MDIALPIVLMVAALANLAAAITNPYRGARVLFSVAAVLMATAAWLAVLSG